MKNFTRLKETVETLMNVNVLACNYNYEFTADRLNVSFSSAGNELFVVKSFVWENASGRMSEIWTAVRNYLEPIKDETLPHFATAIDAAEACRNERGDRFATADEMETLRNVPDMLRDIFEGMHNVVFIVDEYAAQEKADADAYAAEIAELNANAAIPAGYVEVTEGPITAGDYVWNKNHGGFDIYNYDVDILAEICFLVCRRDPAQGVK